MQNLRFFKIYGVLARTREREGSATTDKRGGEVNFSRFCADVLYGRPLRITIYLFLAAQFVVMYRRLSREAITSAWFVERRRICGFV